MNVNQPINNNNLEGVAPMNQDLVSQPEILQVDKYESNDNSFDNEPHLLQILSADYEYTNMDEAEGKAQEIKHRTTQSLRAFRAGNEIESMLAAQMIVTHNASMECYARLQTRYTDETTLIDSDLNNASKLSRTFVTLLEAFQRCRQD
jgi:hypothetical protein